MDSPRTANGRTYNQYRLSCRYKGLCPRTDGIFASKLNALISRAAVRDIYDVYGMIQ